MSIPKFYWQLIELVIEPVRKYQYECPIAYLSG